MTFFIRRCIILFLIFEVTIFFVVYCFGPKSIKTLFDVYRQTEKMDEEIALLEQENNELRSCLQCSQSPFAKERIAREQLLMKREDEIIYFVK